MLLCVMSPRTEGARSSHRAGRHSAKRWFLMYEASRAQGNQQNRGSRFAAKGSRGNGYRVGDPEHDNGRGIAGRRQDHTMNIAELAVRGTTMLFDIQMAALRSIWQMQARSAAALGAPDCSD